MGRNVIRSIEVLLLFLHQGSSPSGVFAMEGREEIGQEFLYSPGQGCGPFEAGCSYLSGLQGPLTPCSRQSNAGESSGGPSYRR